MTNITQTPKASRSEKPKMVYTPEYKIPIGEAITLPDGHLGLRIKKTGANVYEEIPIDHFLGLVFQAARETA